MKKIITLLFLIVLTLPSFAQSEQSLLLEKQKGVYQQEVAGNLESAIQIYSEIMQKADGHPRIAAEILFRLGSCYSKLGEAEKATQCFKKVVNDYPEQTYWVSMAKQEIVVDLGDLTGKSEKELSTWAKAAVLEGQLLTGVDIEMQRVLVRAKNKHAYKDKIDLGGLYEELPEEYKKTVSQKRNFFQLTVEYLEKHQGEKEYEWRVAHLASVIAQDLGWDDIAAEYLDRTLESYPDVEYPSPRKNSKYHHLVHERAEIIWKEKGVTAAEDYFLKHLANDPKCEFFHEGWWVNQYDKRGQLDRLPQMNSKVLEAYRQRIKNVPEDSETAKEYLADLERRQTEKDALESGDFLGLLDAQMEMIEGMANRGHVWKDKNTLTDVLEKLEREKSQTPVDLANYRKIAHAYLEKHQGKVEYDWRIYHLLANLNLKLGEKQAALKYFDDMLEAYPDIDYAIPSKFSYYQHLANEKAELLWEMEGRQAAEEFLLEQVAQNSKMDYFFPRTMQRMMGDTEFEMFKKKMVLAYAERKKRFPEQVEKINEYIQQLSASE